MGHGGQDALVLPAPFEFDNDPLAGLEGQAEDQSQAGKREILDESDGAAAGAIGGDSRRRARAQRDPPTKPTLVIR